MPQEIQTLTWLPDGGVRLLDQTRLPREEVYIDCRDVEAVAEAIRSLRIRGAPALGVTAAMGLALGAQSVHAPDVASFLRDLKGIADLLARTRPTARNLFWGLDRVLTVADKHRDLSLPLLKQRLVEEALTMHREDLACNRAIGEHGQRLVESGDTLLTHCNTGALATVGYGTALGVIRAAWEHGKRIQVLVDETRPVLQGARLTAWELDRLGIPSRLITDSMAGDFMRRGEVRAVILGADRIALNGDVANKIGTYTLAVLCRYHHVPFYVAAPLSTVDPTLPTGTQIPIEERGAQEITSIAGVPIAPDGFPAANPAFDVTPAGLVSALITDQGVLRPPLAEAIHALRGSPSPPKS
ncbi:MAG: S-methyl-5-thioribose-1-phosphate isomerase [Candidatus Methylomirabilales bacterium]